MEDLNDVIRSSPVVVKPDRYTIASVSDYIPMPLLCSSVLDGEITVISLEGSIPAERVLSKRDGFRLLVFRISKPFAAPGFIATLSSTLAKQQINVFVISLFSVDCVLIQEDDLPVAVQALESRGFAIQVESTDS